MATEGSAPEKASATEPDGIVGAKSLGRNTGFSLAAELALAAGRMFTFFLLARALGTAGLGRYVAVLGLAQLIFPASRLGIAHLMVRSISRSEPFAPEWAKATTVNIFGGLTGAVLTSVIAAVLFDVSVLTAALITTGQLVGLGLQQSGGMAAAAHGRSEVALAINGVSTVIRVAMVVAFFYLVDEQTIDSWAPLFFVVMVTGSISTVSIIKRAFGARVRLAIPSTADLRLGSGFVFVELANSAQADIDKVVLGGFGLDEDTGVYTAAYRVADLANIPLAALVRASYSEFFRRGSNTITEAVRYAKKLTAFAFTYGLIVGIGLWIFAPLIEFAIGDEFAESVTALRWIAFVPAIRATQFFPANVLSATDRQWVRAKIMSATAVLNLIANLILIPQLGWRGAAISTLVAEVVFSGGLWIAIRRALRAEREAVSV